MHHVDKYGIGKVVEMALEHVGKNRPIHLSFDVGTSLVVLFLPSTNAPSLTHWRPLDALDPTVAPSTGTAVSPSQPPSPTPAWLR